MSTIIFDEEFIRELEEDPASLLIALGIEPTKEILGEIGKLDTDALRGIVGSREFRSRSRKEVALVFP